MKYTYGTIIAVAAALFFYLRLIILQRQKVKRFSSPAKKERRKNHPDVRKEKSGEITAFPKLDIISPYLLGSGILLIFNWGGPFCRALVYSTSQGILVDPSIPGDHYDEFFHSLTFMLTEPMPTCPNCNSTDKTFKVSLLYIEGAAWLNHQNIDQAGQLSQVMKEYLPEASNRVAQDQFVTRLNGLLAPPAGQKQVMRQIHPDGMVSFFLVISMVILYNAFRSQPESLPVIVILIAAGFTAYFIFRKSILSRYNMRKNQGQQEIIKIEKAISRWMRTYFCARDQCVFDPITGHNASLEQLKDFFTED